MMSTFGEIIGFIPAGKLSVQVGTVLPDHHLFQQE
jgi:hypothetical protein